MALAPCGAETWRPFLLGGCCHRPHATYPDGEPETALRVAPRTAPIRSCSRWGLPCRSCCQSRGGLLPHPFTLAAIGPASSRRNRGGLLSVALSLGSPPPAINRHRVSMEPGLSSPAAFRLLLVRPPGQLATRIKGFASQNANEKAGALSSARSSAFPPRGDASPCCNRPTKPGSCAWRHGRHCISGSCRRSCRRRAHAPWPRYFMPYLMFTTGL